MFVHFSINLLKLEKFDLGQNLQFGTEGVHVLFYELNGVSVDL